MSPAGGGTAAAPGPGGRIPRRRRTDPENGCKGPRKGRNFPTRTGMFHVKRAACPECKLRALLRPHGLPPSTDAASPRVGPNSSPDAEPAASLRRNGRNEHSEQKKHCDDAAYGEVRTGLDRGRRRRRQAPADTSSKVSTYPRRPGRTFAKELRADSGCRVVLRQLRKFHVKQSHRRFRSSEVGSAKVRN